MSVSVIIPTYNRIDLLKETLTSCAKQSLEEFEVVIVDDGSSDDVSGYVKNWKRDLRSGIRVEYMDHSGNGAPSARNAGAKASTGSSICFLDSDDLMAPDKLAELSSVLDTNPKADAAYGLCEFFNEEPGDEGTLWNAPDGRDLINRFLLDDAVWDTCSVLWNRTAFNEAGKWNEDLSCWQDWELHLRALARGGEFVHVPQILQHCREHQESRISEQPGQRRRHVQSKYDAIFSIWDELVASGILTKVRRESLIQMMVVRAVEASDFHLDGLAGPACREAISRVEQPDMLRRLRYINRRTSTRFGTKARRARRFRDACVKQGWHTQNVFPDSNWHLLEASDYRTSEV